MIIRINNSTVGFIVDGNVVEFETLKGPALTAEEFESFLKISKIQSWILKTVQTLHRKDAIKFERMDSDYGSATWHLYTWTKYGYLHRAGFHISMYNKINSRIRLYAADFIDLCQYIFPAAFKGLLDGSDDTTDMLMLDDNLAPCEVDGEQDIGLFTPPMDECGTRIPCSFSEQTDEYLLHHHPIVEEKAVVLFEEDDDDDEYM